MAHQCLQFNGNKLMILILTKNSVVFYFCAEILFYFILSKMDLPFWKYIFLSLKKGSLSRYTEVIRDLTVHHDVSIKSRPDEHEIKKTLLDSSLLINTHSLCRAVYDVGLTHGQWLIQRAAKFFFVESKSCTAAKSFIIRWFMMKLFDAAPALCMMQLFHSLRLCPRLCRTICPTRTKRYRFPSGLQ